MADLRTYLAWGRRSAADGQQLQPGAGRHAQRPGADSPWERPSTALRHVTPRPRLIISHAMDEEAVIARE